MVSSSGETVMPAGVGPRRPAARAPGRAGVGGSKVESVDHSRRREDWHAGGTRVTARCRLSVASPGVPSGASTTVGARKHQHVGAGHRNAPTTLAMVGARGATVVSDHCDTVPNDARP